MKPLCALVAMLALGIVGLPAQTNEPNLFVPQSSATPAPAATASPSSTDPNLIRPVSQPELMDLIPSLPASNMARSVDFYKRLGFAVIIQNSSYTSVGRDLVQIGLYTDKNAAQGRHASTYINMSEVEPYMEMVKANGVKIATPLKTQPSGMKEFSVADPDGNTITFGEYIKK